jgi:hypothetical protein
VLLTCRALAYADIVESSDVFTSAAVIELQPLPFDVARDYLLQTAPPMRGPGGRRSTRWTPVFQHIAHHPNEPRSHALRKVLRTPLMVAMARAVYNDSAAAADPLELLSPRFGSPDTLESHLLDAFVPAAFTAVGARNEHRAARWSADEAQRWLGFLARHMQRHHTRDLAWWELCTTLPRPLRRLGPILLIGSVAAMVSLAMSWFAGSSPLFMVCAVTVGAGLGFVALSGRGAGAARRWARAGIRGLLLRQAVLSLVVVAPLSVALGFVQSFAQPGWFDPSSAPGGSLGMVIIGSLYGVATAVVLAILGVTSSPRPSTMPSRKAGPPTRWVMGATTILLSAGLAFLTSGILLSEYMSDSASVPAAAVIAVLTALLVVVAMRKLARTPEAPAAHLPRRHLNRTFFPALAVGLLSGLLFGAAWGLADAFTLSLRVQQQIEHRFAGKTYETLAGTRYLPAMDGWQQGLSADGTRSVRSIGNVTGYLVRASEYGEAYAATTVQGAADEHLCADRGWCTLFSGRIELISGRGPHPDTVRVPDGTVLYDLGWSSHLPESASVWLIRSSPSELFEDAVAWGFTFGLSLGLVAGCAAGLRRRLNSPADVTRALNPLASLHIDRATAVTLGVTVATFGATLSIIVTQFGETVTLRLLSRDHTASSIALLIWLPIALVLIGMTAWGWLVVTRLWLSGMRYLPWRLMAFLDEAHRKGVLRQVGAVYQFRHIRLQEQLAARDQ